MLLKQFSQACLPSRFLNNFVKPNLHRLECHNEFNKIGAQPLLLDKSIDAYQWIQKPESSAEHNIALLMLKLLSHDFLTLEPI